MNPLLSEERSFAEPSLLFFLLGHIPQLDAWLFLATFPKVCSCHNPKDHSVKVTPQQPKCHQSDDTASSADGNSSLFGPYTMTDAVLSTSQEWPLLVLTMTQ